MPALPSALPFALARLAAAFAVAGALAGCTNMTQTPAGTPLADVEAQWGRPNFFCDRPDGGRRVIWTQQPMGQYAWGTNVTPDGRVGPVVSILRDEHFRLLSQGTWSADQVRCEFGPPARVSEAGLGSSRQVVWAYRYREADTWNSLMYVYLGPDGRQVTRFHPGPDPMYDDERFFGL